MATRTPTLSAPGFDPSNSRVKPIVDVTLRVVTPMIGGGVDTGRVDPDFPVNGKSIRGHLRFWWRACNAHRFATAAELFDAEAKIWGAAAQADRPHEVSFSPVQVEVRILDWGIKERNGFVDTRRNVEFRLRLTALASPGRCEGLEREVDIAARAWIAFGGIGAKTRRGYGSLRRVIADDRLEIGPNVDLALISAYLRQHGKFSHPLFTPQLMGSVFRIGMSQEDHESAWWIARKHLSDFRSGTDRDYVIAPDQEGYFTRAMIADLGFPVFISGLLAKRVAQGRGKRMASPIIVKPLAWTKDESVPLVLCLNAPHFYSNAQLYGLPDSGIPPITLRQMVLQRKNDDLAGKVAL